MAKKLPLAKLKMTPTTNASWLPNTSNDLFIKPYKDIKIGVMKQIVHRHGDTESARLVHISQTVNEMTPNVSHIDVMCLE